MSPELENRLYRTWPEIFRGQERPITEGSMLFGIDADDGWFVLLDVLCQVLTERAESLGQSPWEAVQIKEKFGGLRFYAYGTGDHYSEGVIRYAERLSFRICEISGAPGRLCTRHGRFATLSPAVAQSNGYEVIPGETTPLPPLSTYEVARILQGRWPHLIRCEPQVNGGWFDIVDVMLKIMSIRERTDAAGEIYVDELHEAAGELIIRATTHSAGDRGAIAMAVAMAQRLDPETGEPYGEF